MTHQSSHIAIVFAAITSLFACSGRETKVTTELTSNTSSLDSSVLEEHAIQFDKYLRGILDEGARSQIKQDCINDLNKNFFCPTILQQSDYDQLSTRKMRTGIPRGAIQSVKVKFQRKKILNWSDLRFAPVSGLIKGLSVLGPIEFDRVRLQSVNEKKCPNNVAIAVAALLEDYLPERVTNREIGKMYEAGAKCIAEELEDKTVLLTRAGTFYLAAKEQDLAKQVFQKALTLNGTNQARPLYWLYKTLKDQHKNKQAAKYLQELEKTYPFSFHALVALTENSKDPGETLLNGNVNHLTRSPENSEINKLLEQVEILRKYELTESASRVLDWAVKLAQKANESELLLHISDLKEDAGDYQSKISILTGVLTDNPDLISRQTMEKYFPKPYFPIFQSNSRGLDPYLLLSVARRESAFNRRAVSSANAMGLLQVTPGTLKEMRLEKDLMDPADNVEAGATYLSSLIEKANGQIHLALAAYNAGPRRLSQWTSRYPLSDPILFIDLIPFRETREYVAAVLRNYYWYRRIHSDQKNISLLPQ